MTRNYINVQLPLIYLFIQNSEFTKVAIILIPYFNSQRILNNIATDKNLRFTVLFLKSAFFAAK